LGYAPVAAPVWAVYVAGVKDLVGILSSIQQTGGSASDRRQAQRQIATLGGALALPGATAGDPIPEDFLAARREMLAPDGRGGD
jgi:hypothetical protein